MAHQRPENHPEPDAFRPERFLGQNPPTNTWIPFGGGVRRCIGAGFAQMEGVAVLREVLALRARGLEVRTCSIRRTAAAQTRDQKRRDREGKRIGRVVQVHQVHVAPRLDMGDADIRGHVREGDRETAREQRAGQSQRRIGDEIQKQRQSDQDRRDRKGVSAIPARSPGGRPHREDRGRGGRHQHRAHHPVRGRHMRLDVGHHAREATPIDARRHQDEGRSAGDSEGVEQGHAPGPIAQTATGVTTHSCFVADLRPRRTIREVLPLALPEVFGER